MLAHGLRARGADRRGRGIDPIVQSFCSWFATTREHRRDQRSVTWCDLDAATTTTTTQALLPAVIARKGQVIEMLAAVQRPHLNLFHPDDAGA
jgi:hypothetical protein